MEGIGYLIVSKTRGVPWGELVASLLCHQQGKIANLLGNHQQFAGELPLIASKLRQDARHGYTPSRRTSEISGFTSMSGAMQIIA